MNCYFGVLLIGKSRHRIISEIIDIASKGTENENDSARLAIVR